MQVQTTFAIYDIGRGGRATRNGGPQDIAVKSPIAVAGRSDVGRSDGGALTVGHIGVKGARVPRSQKGALPRPLEGRQSSWHWARRARRALPKSTAPVRLG